MNKEKFIKLLNNAEVDDKGNLYYWYYEDKPKNYEENHKVYFATIRTVCDDLIESFAYKEKNGYELYDRHFWNDDTLEAKIVNLIVEEDNE